MILATATSSGLTLGDISAGIGILVFVVGLASAGVTYMLRRRETRGTTDTSDADVLWDQAQKMRAELQEQLEAVTTQRDKLVEFQSGQVLPALGTIATSLSQITNALTRLEVQITKALTRLEAKEDVSWTKEGRQQGAGSRPPDRAGGDSDNGA